MVKVVNWLCDTQDKILFVEDISGFGFLILVGTMALVVAMCCSKKLRKLFF